MVAYKSSSGIKSTAFKSDIRIARNKAFPKVNNFLSNNDRVSELKQIYGN